MKIIKNSILNKIFWSVLAAFLLAVVTSNCLVYPFFTGMLLENTESQAIILGKHISRIDFSINKRGNIEPDQENLIEINRAMDEFNLYKLKIFSPAGKVIYSSNNEEIGDFNENNYFRNVIAHGYVHSKTVQKDSFSPDGRKTQENIIETSIPIMRDGFFAGALEIHLDITDRTSALRNTLNIFNVMVIALISMFSSIILTPLVQLDKTLAEREETNKYLEKSNALLSKKIRLRRHTQHEKEKLVNELRTSLMKVKLLSGFLPICSGCKKIRDDRGDWNHIETYIKEHSEAEFSHGICPDCAKEYYPQFIQLTN